jgi:RNA polymerase sigma-70 factor (ECF subfamily)
MIDDDAPVVLAVQNGDLEAFGTLVDRHKDRVYAILKRLIADSATAEELAHEAFVRAYRSLPTFRGEARFGTWLVQIAINLARDQMRSNRRATIVSLQDLKHEEAESLVDTRSSHDPLARLDEQQLVDRIRDALDQLPDAYRLAFVLKHLEDLPYARISEITGDNIGALKVRVHRARKLLFDAVTGHGGSSRSKVIKA